MGEQMKTRIPALDGLRALAILLVLFCHVQVFLRPLSGRPGRFCTDMAWSGVYLFFVLSGYLIGSLVLTEIDRTGRLQIGSFWARRALRTWPLYFLALAANYWFARAAGIEPFPPLWNFVTFTQIFFKNTYFVESWSLSIEEQFYLVLPLFFAAVLRVTGRRGVAGACLLMMAVSWLVRTRTGYELRPATTFDVLFIGVLVADLHVRRTRVFDWLRRYPTAMFVAATALLYVIYTRYGMGGLRQFQGLLGVAFAMMLIAALNPGGVPARLLGLRAWTWIALSSYSAYLSHMFVIRWLAASRVLPSALGAWGSFATAVAMSLATGWVIYALVEKPLLRARERIAPRQHNVAEPPEGIVAEGAPRSTPVTTSA